MFATKTIGAGGATRVTARNFTGDGFYLYTGATRSRFFDVIAIGNDRNGLTLGAMVDGTLRGRQSLRRQPARQQVDSEPGGTNMVTNTTITRCVLDGAGVSNEYALTVSGTPSTPGHDWVIIGNEINGGVFVVWADHVLIAGNTGVNPTTKSSVTVYQAVGTT